MATPDNKRKADEPANGDGAAPEEQQAKKPRLSSGPGPNGGAAGAPPPPGVDLSVLEKARKALAMQAVLKEKLLKLRQAGTAAAPGPARPATRMPPPLVLDAEGREVGAAPAAAPPPPKAPLRLLPAEEEEGAEAVDERFFDPEIGRRGRGRAERRPRPEIQFVQEGTFQKAAETSRLRAEFGDDYVKDLAQRRRQEKAMAAQGDANLIPLGARPATTAEEDKEQAEVAAAAVPNVEWWDARILADRTSYGAAAEGGDAALRPDRISHYVEHPVQLAPPAEAPPPPPQPLRLTKAELKKLRTQRRQAREQEKQELVRQGLLEPPKPKVKISNLMRVLGAEAAADPTAIEAEVRRQMAERVAAHADRNLARMLTPAERREKKLRKLLDNPAAAQAGGDAGDAPIETLVAVYKVLDLTSPQLRFKVAINAQENHMSGAAVVAAGAFALVVVEGGPKTLRRYEKLMLRRIDWAAPRADDAADDADDAGDAMAADAPPNYCHLVWQGVVKEPAFRGKFKTMDLPSEAAARRVLDERGVGHYWDLAAAYNPE